MNQHNYYPTCGKLLKANSVSTSMDKPVKVFLNVMANGYVRVAVATNKDEYVKAQRQNYACKNRDKIRQYQNRYNVENSWTCPECVRIITARSIDNHIQFVHNNIEPTKELDLSNHKTVKYTEKRFNGNTFERKQYVPIDYTKEDVFRRFKHPSVVDITDITFE